MEDGLDQNIHYHGHAGLNWIHKRAHRTTVLGMPNSLVSALREGAAEPYLKIESGDRKGDGGSGVS